MRELKFYECLELTLRFEGGTNVDPLDRGGTTKWGISEKSYPQVSSPNFTKEDAIEIYYTDYWVRNSCDSFKLPIAMFLFDSSVNCGQESAAVWLQKSFNFIIDRIKVDGIVGPKTIMAVNGIDSYRLLHGFCFFRYQRYIYLIKKYPKQKRFIQGWINRVSYLQKEIVSGFLFPSPLIHD